MGFKFSRSAGIATAAMLLLLVFFMSALGPIVLLLTIGALGLTLIGLPVLLLMGRRRRAGQLLVAYVFQILLAFRAE